MIILMVCISVYLVIARSVAAAPCGAYAQDDTLAVRIFAEDTGGEGGTFHVGGTVPCGGAIVDPSITITGSNLVGGFWACDLSTPRYATAIACFEETTVTLTVPPLYTCAETVWKSIKSGITLASGIGCTASCANTTWELGSGVTNTGCTASIGLSWDGSKTQGVTFVMALADQSPVGYHEPAPAVVPSCDQISGWACDGDDFNETLNVNIYDGDSSGTLLATVPAGSLREAAVGTACGNTGNSNHGYSWTIPDPLKDGTNHNIHVYAENIDPSGTPIGNDPLLTWSPHTINCIPDPWYKLQGASLYKNGAVNNFIPVLPQAYDTDDTADRFLVVRGTTPRVTQEGVALSGLNIYLGTSAQTSTSQWQRQNYTRSVGYLGNLTSFIEYAKLRKKFKIITDLTQMESNTINIFAGNVPISNPGDINGSIDNAVLLVQGNITLDINPSNNSLALIATGAINIHSTVQEIHGILIANTIDISYDGPSTGELKVIGNLIATNDIDAAGLKRERTEWQQPSLFIQFDPNMYVDLLVPLSTIIQEGRTIE